MAPACNCVCEIDLWRVLPISDIAISLCVTLSHILNASYIQYPWALLIRDTKSCVSFGPAVMTGKS